VADAAQNVASLAAAAPTSRRSRRRAESDSDEPSTIDVNLVMQLLLASHSLETIAQTAETGDASLGELIDAARRTRTVAVDLVTRWFGGTTRMREFAEALLTATEY
ncbi:MAG: hypothetical protein J2P18_09905, partial [Nocardia sp.]|nr:hypothetical protein [Nocardia sp.]